jgi:hypothetical protein
MAPVDAARREAGGWRTGSIRGTSLLPAKACAVCCCKVSIALTGGGALEFRPRRLIADRIRSAWVFEAERTRGPDDDGGGGNAGC